MNDNRKDDKTTTWLNWLLVPLTMIVLGIGGYVCTEVATKDEVASVKADVRLILEHLLGSRAAIE